jgi:hypothetical protein
MPQWQIPVLEDSLLSDLSHSMLADLTDRFRTFLRGCAHLKPDRLRLVAGSVARLLLPLLSPRHHNESHRVAHREEVVHTLFEVRANLLDNRGRSVLQLVTHIHPDSNGHRQGEPGVN